MCEKSLQRAFSFLSQRAIIRKVLEISTLRERKNLRFFAFSTCALVALCDLVS